ncbi:MAG TPA: hypothetical protein VFB79_05755 [Candidatus Angelobacter sp.]|nr:hypothetical protein [Candidatus Angelobacter sp.]
MLWTVLLETLGIGTVLFTLRDVFHDIFHPTRTGSLSDLIDWLGSRLFGHTKFRPAIGPACLVTVIAAWVFFIGIGFALIYLPLIPNDIGAQVITGMRDRIVHALYLSFGSVATFQIFDIDLNRNWLKLVVAFQWLVGISLITASVSWLVLLYPALERMRFVAIKTLALVEVEERRGHSSLNEGLLTAMADRVLQARIDLILFPILLNFYPSDPSQTLGSALPHLLRFAEQATNSASSEALNSAGIELTVPLERFARMLTD